MDLYYNDQKVASLPIEPTSTIGQVKEILRNWLTPQGVTKYTISLRFNNGTGLSTSVFEVDTYDAMDFQAQAELLTGGSIMVNVSQINPTTQTTAALPQAAQQTAPTKHTGVYDAVTLKALTVAKLKVILREQKKKVGGRKQELIDRILGVATAPVAKKTQVPPVQQTQVPNQQVPNQQPQTQQQVPNQQVPPVETQTYNVVPIYAIKDDNDNYTGFTSKEDALRWWVESELPTTDTILDVNEPINYEGDVEQEIIEEAMENEEYFIVEINMR